MNLDGESLVLFKRNTRRMRRLKHRKRAKEEWTRGRKKRRRLDSRKGEEPEAAMATHHGHSKNRTAQKQQTSLEGLSLLKCRTKQMRGRDGDGAVMQSLIKCVVWLMDQIQELKRLISSQLDWFIGLCRWWPSPSSQIIWNKCNDNVSNGRKNFW